MVIFQDGDGKPGYHEVDDLDHAIRHVERLRNDEGVEQARIFQMEEVVFEFRPYFRVEVGAGTTSAGDATAAPDAPEAEAPAPTPRPRTSPWTRPLEQAPQPVEEAVVEEAAVEPQPLEAALKAMVGEPAGAPWPDEEDTSAASATHDSLSANGARRGLFGR